MENHQQQATFEIMKDSVDTTSMISDDQKSISKPNSQSWLSPNAEFETSLLPRTVMSNDVDDKPSGVAMKETAPMPALIVDNFVNVKLEDLVLKRRVDTNPTISDDQNLISKPNSPSWMLPKAEFETSLLPRTAISNDFDGKPSGVAMKETTPMSALMVDNFVKVKLDDVVLKRQQVLLQQSLAAPSPKMPKSSAKIKILQATLPSTLLAKKKKRKHFRYGRWSKDQDELLRLAVTETRGHNWKYIAEVYFHGLRTGAQCRSRWTRALDPALNLNRWTQEEDDFILKAVAQGYSIAEISKALPGRRLENVRARYNFRLDPTLKKGPWSDEDKQRLFNLVGEKGQKWRLIAPFFPNRSEASCKNTWFNALASRKRKAQRDQEQSTIMQAYMEDSMLESDLAIAAAAFIDATKTPKRMRFEDSELFQV